MGIVYSLRAFITPSSSKVDCATNATATATFSLTLKTQSGKEIKILILSQEGTAKNILNLISLIGTIEIKIRDKSLAQIQILSCNLAIKEVREQFMVTGVKSETNDI